MKRDQLSRRKFFKVFGAGSPVLAVKPFKGFAAEALREKQNPATNIKDAGFTTENYSGITIRGTECKDENGSFYDTDGKLYGERNIDKDWYYWADVEGEYDAETMPYMVNTGKYSYFSKIVTQEVDKIINIPILKNAGGSITNAMKNLAFGSVSNTGRLHTQLWNETCAEVCAFAPLRVASISKEGNLVVKR